MITDWPTLPYKQFEFKLYPKMGLKVVLLARSEDEAKARLIESGYQINDADFEKSLEEMFKEKK